MKADINTVTVLGQKLWHYTLTTITTTFPANVTITEIPTNATTEQAAANATEENTTVTTAVPTGTPTAPTTGNITVASSPLGASVLLDGVLSGSTPENLTGIAAGNHIIRLTLSGYYDYEGTIYVVPGRDTDVFGTLPPLSSSSGSVMVVVTQAATATPSPVVTVLPTATASGGLLENPTIVASVLGIVAASIGAVAAIFPHLSKFKK
ncbi:MAG: PEGA domain-containing protein [Methanoregula sp.]|uniref:PEGA domain-containing protein n=1 Tax=Methanoregula sp. TaxID=2052170 RepID=UPI003BB0757A